MIQAIGGVIFSIEGFWGAVKYDPPTIKRFLIFLICYFLVSTAIAVINLETLHAYCSTAVNDDDEASCLRTAKLYSYLLLGVTLGFVVRRDLDIKSNIERDLIGPPAHSHVFTILWFLSLFSLSFLVLASCSISRLTRRNRWCDVTTPVTKWPIWSTEWHSEQIENEQ